MYDFRHLPEFARYLLNGHVRQLVEDQLALSKEMKVPVLRFFSHIPDEQMIELSMEGATELLEYLAQNKAREQITLALEKWVANQLPMLQQVDLVAEDLTLINYVRGRVFKNWAAKFARDNHHLQSLVDEIDVYFLGSTTSATTTYIDILKNKIEEESHLSTQLINASPGLVFLFDLKRERLVFVNEKVKDLLGYPPREMEDWDLETVYSKVYPEDLESLIKKLLPLASDPSHRTIDVEYRFLHQSGKYVWLRTYSVLFKTTKNGRPLQLLGQSFDISSQKEISISLEKREEQLLAAQELARVGSFEWDIQNDTSTVTPELVKILGDTSRPIEEFLSKVHPADQGKMRKEIEKALKTGEHDFEYRYLAPDGEKILWGKAVVLFKDGKPYLMKGTVQDITSRKKAEQELKQKTMDLQRSNENLQQFASIASHDLNEPLRKIATFTDLVMAAEGDKLSERSKGYLKKVMDSSKRMRGMIDDILAFSAVNKPQQPEPYSLQSILEEAIDILEHQVKQKLAVITSDGLPRAMIIPFQMRQLFQNLLSNSIKFVKKGEHPRIEITHEYADHVEHPEPGLKPADKYLVIRFRDNGIGFEKEYADRIFGLFNRLHGKQAYEGTGIGLAICRKAAENHGGSLKADSEPGKGALFTLYLPQ